MKKKIVIIIFAFGLGLVASTIFSIPKSNLDKNIVAAMEAGRQEGYNESYIEFAYSTGLMPNVPENTYNDYFDAKKNYEGNQTLENFKKLAQATQQVLENK